MSLSRSDNRHRHGADNSSPLRRMMRISIRPMNDDLVRLSERILVESYILVEVEMIKSQLICEFGL